MIIMVFTIMPVISNAFERYNKVVGFDRYFSKYSKRYFGPFFDWRYFKAQAIAESNLKVNAFSQAGAFGIMQIMPKTFTEIRQKELRIKGDRAQPRWNIAAGIYYDRQMWKMWKSRRSVSDRINFMFGSYNAGKRNILKTQKKAKLKGLNPNLWTSIEHNLSSVTGNRSKETIGYVKKINQIKGVLK